MISFSFHEEWVVDVDHGNNHPLLLLPLPDPHRHATPWNFSLLLSLPTVVVDRVVEMRNIENSGKCCLYYPSRENFNQVTEIACLDLCLSVKGYEKTIDKGSEAKMANLKRFREESVIEVGKWLMINGFGNWGDKLHEL
ncbi:50S ribosomal protein [Actinidia chinensis var. chinensis]|uniref:50S ribosomal protein n=1 Tax=Actinidia chinensis var. chinensis TaxID=1590841 RepID=A0A2R6QPS4_ACTCC|nr:50S ribosomal protein [Actinidia chinensis var. chinensis]